MTIDLPNSSTRLSFEAKDGVSCRQCRSGGVSVISVRPSIPCCCYSFGFRSSCLTSCCLPRSILSYLGEGVRFLETFAALRFLSLGSTS